MGTSDGRTNGAGALPATAQQPGGGKPEAALVPFLGWFSLGLGVAQMAAPGAVARLIGLRDDDRSRLWMRVVGVRELAAAAGILSRRRPAGWVWARVAGDGMDLALLGAGLAAKQRDAGRVAGAAAAVTGIAAADAFTGVRMGRAPEPPDKEPAMKMKGAITVRRSPEEVYGFWRDFANFPQFMTHLESVTVSGDRRSHWKASGPAGRSFEWDAEITDDRPNELIAWRSLEGANVPNSGSVRFMPAPRDQGTEIRLEMEYEPPGGAVGAAVARLFGQEPATQADDDLRRFKQVMETGTVVRSDGSPEGTRAGRQLRQRPAQPLTEGRNA
jgi:uncharacterized membrane protein